MYPRYIKNELAGIFASSLKYEIQKDWLAIHINFQKRSDPQSPKIENAGKKGLECSKKLLPICYCNLSVSFSS